MNSRIIPECSSIRVRRHRFKSFRFNIIDFKWQSLCSIPSIVLVTQSKIKSTAFKVFYRRKIKPLKNNNFQPYLRRLISKLGTENEKSTNWQCSNRNTHTHSHTWSNNAHSLSIRVYLHWFGTPKKCFQNIIFGTTNDGKEKHIHDKTCRPMWQPKN